MTLQELFNVLSAPYRIGNLLRLDRYFKRQEHRQRLREIIDAAWIDDPDGFLLDLMENSPDQLADLLRASEKMQPAAPGRPEGTTSHTPDEQIKIALEATELRERGRRNWKNFICEKYDISERTMYRYRKFARSEND